MTSEADAEDIRPDMSLPLARVKRIIKQDDEIVTVSSGAVFATAAAAELFVKHFTDHALLSARGNRRKKLAYSDFAAAVAQQSELEFLSTLVPRTVPYRTVKEKPKEKSTRAAPTEATDQPASKGQSTLSFLPAPQNQVPPQLMSQPPMNMAQQHPEQYLPPPPPPHMPLQPLQPMQHMHPQLQPMHQMQHIPQLQQPHMAQLAPHPLHHHPHPHQIHMHPQVMQQYVPMPQHPHEMPVPMPVQEHIPANAPPGPGPGHVDEDREGDVTMKETR